MKWGAAKIANNLPWLEIKNVNNMIISSPSINLYKWLQIQSYALFVVNHCKGCMECKDILLLGMGINLVE